MSVSKRTTNEIKETVIENLPDYKYNGARSLVMLHQIHLKSFLAAWREANKAGVVLPQTDDPDYESMHTLLFHVIRSSRGYIRWICENLEIEIPEFEPLPPIDKIEDQAESYIEYLIERWDSPLRSIDTEKFFVPVFKSNWEVDYCIESMLEHAVMHPIRHEFQLRNLMEDIK